MRLRTETRIRKALRRMQSRPGCERLPRQVASHERSGCSLGTALRLVATDTAAGHLDRGDAARLLALADCHSASRTLLAQFYSQTDRDELWATGLALERYGDSRLSSALIPALADQNLSRRRAAARVLGWLPNMRSRAVTALCSVLTDSAQPVSVREEAAESLAYSYSSSAIPALISVLGDEAVPVRFWAVFALGSFVDHPEVQVALAGMLNDAAVPPGNWWAVSREALAMLGRAEAAYRARFTAELRRVAEDTAATDADRRWLDAYKT